MRTVDLTRTVLLLLVLLLPGSLSAQPSDRLHRRSAILAGNHISTVFGNWGVIGQPAAPTTPRGSWIHPNNGYVGDISILIGLELPFRDYSGDGVPDLVHSVVTCPVSRPTSLPDMDPVTGVPWTLEPDGGFFAPYPEESVAMREDPQTWPPIWPDHPEWGTGVWNGLFGPNTFAGDHEAYFRMGDENDQHFNFALNNPQGIVFRPDTNNAARPGQGIRVTARYVLVDSIPFQDALFRIFDITNESVWRYQKVVLGSLCGTYIGITGNDDTPQEYDDDIAVLYKSQNLVDAWDFNNDVSRNPNWHGVVGHIGETFLEAPGGGTIASFTAFDQVTEPGLGDDESLWDVLTPGVFQSSSFVLHDTVAVGGSGADYLYGTAYFSLEPGETRRIVSAIVYGYSREELYLNAQNATMLWNAQFNTATVLASVHIDNFETHRKLAGVEPVSWTSARPGGTVDAWFRPDPGQPWTQIASRAANSGQMDWNTVSVEDCAFGTLKLIVSDTAGKPYGFSETEVGFAIDNPGNGRPFISILNQELGVDTPITAAVYDVTLLAADPEDSMLVVKGYYRTSVSATWEKFDEFSLASDPAPGVRSVGLGGLPNSDTFQLKFTASDGEAERSDSTAFFSKHTPRVIVPPTNVLHLSGPADALVEMHVVDPDLVRPDTYLITIDDTSASGEVRFSVYNQTEGGYELSAVPLLPRQESRAFDGLSLYTEATASTVDGDRSGWNRGPRTGWSFNFSAINLPLLPLYGYAFPSDYIVTFSTQPLDTSIAWDPIFTPEPIPYRITNAATGAKVSVFVFRQAGLEDIFLAEMVGGVLKPTWELYLVFGSADSSAREGDTLRVFTHKAVSFLDTYSVSGFSTFIGESDVSLGSPQLFQNYPNPFNPSTTIRYGLSRPSNVTLTLYNVLGQQVRTLVRGEQTAGEHEALLDASGLSSGVYLYRLTAGSFVQTRKLLLVH